MARDCRRPTKRIQLLQPIASTKNSRGTQNRHPNERYCLLHNAGGTSSARLPSTIGIVSDCVVQYMHNRIAMYLLVVGLWTTLFRRML